MSAVAPARLRATRSGGAGAFDFNPGAAAGKGDLINLSGSSGAATINAFAFGAARIRTTQSWPATSPIGVRWRWRPDRHR
jgi:hypothetical protein